MKQMIWCAGLLFLFSFPAEAQKTNTTKKTATNKTVRKTTPKKQKSNSTATVDTLSSTSINNAFATSTSPRLFIADPTVSALDARAAGASVRISGSGVAGMPKGSYGFKNGQFKFYNSGATTSGGITGNGSVGTGSFSGGIGVNAAVPGVNGKSPYAGSHMWGLNGAVSPGNKSDSSIRKIELRKE